MTQQKGTNILEGEASESDEELSDYPSFVRNTMVSEPSPPSTPAETVSSTTRSTGVVVSGEASESDDETFHLPSTSTGKGGEQGPGSREFPSLHGHDQQLNELELKVENAGGFQGAKLKGEQRRPKYKS